MENVIENQNKYNEWADRIDELEAAALVRLGNGNNSISHVRVISQDLRRGDIESAKANYSQQSDKYSSIPEIKSFLKEIGLVEEIDFAKYKEAIEIEGDFCDEYEDIASYISWQTLSPLKNIDPNCPENEKSNFCLVLALKDPLPANRHIPHTYKGLRIFIKKQGSR